MMNHGSLPGPTSACDSPVWRVVLPTVGEYRIEPPHINVRREELNGDLGVVTLPLRRGRYTPLRSSMLPPPFGSKSSLVHFTKRRGPTCKFNAHRDLYRASK
jgi:hypothetical protein